MQNKNYKSMIHKIMKWQFVIIKKLQSLEIKQQ